MKGRDMTRRLEALEAQGRNAWCPVWLRLPEGLTDADADAWVAARRAELPPGATVIATNVERMLDR